jgi:DNA-binding response OmpR family regulator
MRVFLVDDNLTIRELVTKVLTESGFKVDSTGNGTKVLQVFRKRPYALVITDLVHPGQLDS